jgi:GNAT superfamily N-acetyltransferase
MAYRALRQKILSTEDAKYFSDSYEREARLTEGQWLRWCTEEPGHCVLGTFVVGELVGIIMITQQGGQESPVVEWEAAWLDPRYRGTGVGWLAYQQAQSWSRKHNYQYVVGFIRAAYTPALDICQNLGFVHVYTISRERWADESVADTHAFLLDLRDQAATFASLPVPERFQTAFEYLNLGLHPPPKGSSSLAA